MNLRALGFGDWFSEHAGDRLQPGQSLARVMTVDRGAYLVRHEGGEVLAELSGKFRFAVESSPDLPCVGDWVCVEQASPTLAIIHAVLPRKTLLRRKCPGKTVDFQMIAVNLLGSSGVGKTSLINRLLGQEALDTKTVSKTGEGVHTTARRQLLVLDNGALLVDTPSMRELGLLGTSGGLEDSFTDIHELAVDCRFPDCTHTQEPGCAVLRAIETGDLSEGRHDSFTREGWEHTEVPVRLRLRLGESPLSYVCCTPAGEVPRTSTSVYS